MQSSSSSKKPFSPPRIKEEHKNAKKDSAQKKHLGCRFARAPTNNGIFKSPSMSLDKHTDDVPLPNIWGTILGLHGVDGAKKVNFRLNHCARKHLQIQSYNTTWRMWVDL
ncbi:hypothetical protein RHMOL_Rhmol01G0189700 [Rhododendron molle]|uniref:Uncharacterized protein n=1 Tax=Rhododendron molle TaxID=49168 RepID=A0ACC0Q2X6_RHOML|nr:hypothetical protein RHMOL_Rhmol01G0189700 [Rhododendron molle]